jgi:hypothetical protein
MGNSRSKSNISIENNIITKYNLDLMNTQTNKAIADTVMRHSANCSASATSIAQNTVGDITAVGPDSVINWETNIEQISSVNLTCIQNSLQDNSIAQSMAASITEQLLHSVDNSQLTKMAAAAEATLSQGVGGGLLNPFSSVDTSVNQNLKNTQLTETQLKIANIVNNTVQTNTKLETLADCVTSDLKNAINKVGNITATEGGKITGKSNIKQTTDVIANCKQLNAQVNKVTSEILSAMNIKIDETVKNKQESDAKAEALSKMEQKGFEGIIEAFGAILGSLLGLAYAPMIMGTIATCCIIICCLISSSLSIMAGVAGGGDSGNESSSTTTE